MNSRKRLAGKILKVSPGKIRFAPDALEEIQKAITGSDIRGLIAVGKIYQNGQNEQSRGRARGIAAQKKKGRRRGRGSKKGKKYSIVTRKSGWINRVRVQREFLQLLKEKQLVSIETFHMLYQKVKGGFFRNKRHIKLYINEYKLVEKGAESAALAEKLVGEVQLPEKSKKSGSEKSETKRSKKSKE